MLLRSNRSLSMVGALLALLLQMHAVLAFALPCVGCVSGNGTVSSSSAATAKPSDLPCHQDNSFAANELASGIASGAERACSHCAGDSCTTATVPVLSAHPLAGLPPMAVVVPSTRIVEPLHPAKFSLPYRPPIA